MRLRHLLLATAGAAFALAAPAQATELVDDDGAECPSAAHRTIQAGVDAAAPGEQVLVCKGVYTENVTIAGHAKDRLDIVARTAQRAVIQLVAHTPGPIVEISGADGVRLRRFRIAGSPESGRPCIETTPGSAVRVTGAATGARVLDNVVSIPCGVGGIEVSGASQATIQSNRVTDFRFSGITVRGVLTNALVDANTVAPGAGAAEFFCEQYGIGVLEQAQANIRSNRVSGLHTRFDACPFDDPGEPSPGLLVRTGSTGQVLLQANRSTGNDLGLLFDDMAGGQAVSNVITGNTMGGILVRAGQGNFLSRNEARGNGGLDCQDLTAGTPVVPTTWIHNRGLDADPATICTPSGR